MNVDMSVTTQCSWQVSVFLRGLPTVLERRQHLPIYLYFYLLKLFLHLDCESTVKLCYIFHILYDLPQSPLMM